MPCACRGTEAAELDIEHANGSKQSDDRLAAGNPQANIHANSELHPLIASSRSASPTLRPASQRAAFPGSSPVKQTRPQAAHRRCASLQPLPLSLLLVFQPGSRLSLPIVPASVAISQLCLAPACTIAGSSSVAAALREADRHLLLWPVARRLHCKLHCRLLVQAHPTPHVFAFDGHKRRCWLQMGLAAS